MANRERYTVFSIRKFKAGVASVLIASGLVIFLGHQTSVQADEISESKIEEISAPQANEEAPKINDEQEIEPVLEQQRPKEEEVGIKATEGEEKISDESPFRARPATDVTPDVVKSEINDTINAETELPAAYLEKANADGSGPFLAGVNSTIPFEAFGGDGMLTRTLLKEAKDAPWSDNGTANNPAILPVESLPPKTYFYQVALDGEATGKTGQELINALKDAGTNTYTATVNVFGNKNGQADEDNVVATRKVKVTINGLTAATDVKKAVEENIKAETTLPAAYLEKANADGSGPFLAGVNGTIPFEAFGGDGMLTRLLLKASENAPWSDNGSAMNAPILPLDKLAKGQYFYQVALEGEAAGKTGKDLLDALKKAGTNTYTATVKVFGNKDGKADESNVVAERQVKLNVNGLTAATDVKKAVEDNIKAETTLPAAYLEKANADGSGPFLAGVNGTIPFEAFGGDGMLTRLLLKASENAPWSDNGADMHAPILPLDKLAKGQYFYQVSLKEVADKTGQELITALKDAGTQTYTAIVKVFGNKDGKADESNVVATREVKVNINGLTAVESVTKAVAENIKAETTVPAAYLEKANADGSGPFLAGVNGTIPFEAFGGDGMLTRLLLKASETAPWSDNGSDMNAPILPLDKLAKGQYFYQVALEGEDVAMKTGKDLLDALKKAGTNTYTATVNVFGNKDGKADESNVVATRKVKVTINGLTAVEDVKKAVEGNIKEETTVPAAYLEKANADGTGPFLAGVNGTIPFEFFGGDGMLTRLLLKASETAPWSDNGSAKNAPILPLDKLAKGQYFYQVSLEGEDVAMKTGKDLLDALKKAGTNTYTATVNVFGNKNGKADEDNVVATRKVKVTINGLTAVENVKDAIELNLKAKTEVPAAYLEKANADGTGPFLAGVNGTIPFEFFGGDGMLTRLLLKASETAPWSDNGSAMNPALQALESLTNGQYFYQVALDGPATGKTGQELLNALKAAGTHTYTATVKVFGNKDGKADESNVVATRQVFLSIFGFGGSTRKIEKQTEQNQLPTAPAMPNNMVQNSQTPMQENMKAQVDQVHPMTNMKQNTAAMMDDKMMKKELPQTGSESSATLTLIGMALASFAGFALRKKSENE
ncbi:YSIRK-type signal peptide-containing protein [Streptococcus sp. zg-86]|uniref:YSIRK-type signal peptide-containing protein n=1 Tax=Streptococcus zhangguiae TaxID=2664091 RepID=A0A6I4RD24_9STRE|nr:MULTISPECIES: fibronectin-binding SSURE repeat-containing protein [unclassified Streptococcus]MTB64598.1 YSIRK-type signal peptide-containing protein [Streptococcus sp. zg-86]MTB90908.1 YSIRK-type signal peptide-containing protein [Streptococcus sp. zg-36]MWV56668.1 YSIRK-type signal peptide-containing protein [Streptococcus sp. zg-70]QTH48626.1 fibronectin-binding SSURE repeat-containing protein [Streptococcus sp. zg-86]